MTDLRKAAQQALEALHYGKANKAVTILREALEQPVQETVACRFCHSKKGCWAWQCYSCGEIDDVQQPAAQRPWVGLTDEEIAQGNKKSWVTEQAWQSAVWWAEAKLKEKNNG
jgi:hypothetical protein